MTGSLYAQRHDAKTWAFIYTSFAVSFAAAMSTIAFAFYIHPIAMPMLREMPPGKAGYDILAWAMRLVITGATRVQLS